MEMSGSKDRQVEHLKYAKRFSLTKLTVVAYEFAPPWPDYLFALRASIFPMPFPSDHGFSEGRRASLWAATTPSRI